MRLTDQTACLSLLFVQDTEEIVAEAKPTADGVLLVALVYPPALYPCAHSHS